MANATVRTYGDKLGQVSAQQATLRDEIDQRLARLTGRPAPAPAPARPASAEAEEEAARL